MTRESPELAFDWVKFFGYLAAQERGWSAAALERFGLKLHNLIAVGGNVDPDTVKALGTMIQFKRGK